MIRKKVEFVSTIKNIFLYSCIFLDDIYALDNCLVTEIRLQNEKCFLTCIYHSLCQNRDEFENFCTSFGILLNNINVEFPLCAIVKGDPNARCSGWWKKDITRLQGQELNSFTLSTGYNQIIDKPTRYKQLHVMY